MNWLRFLSLFFLFIYLASCQKEVSIIEDIQRPSAVSVELFQKADAAYLSSRDKAKDLEIRLKDINRAIKIARENNIDSLQLKYLSYKSAIYSNADDHLSGIKVAETLLTFSRKIKDTAFEAKTLAKIGRNYYDLHEYSLSFKNYFESHDLSLSISDSLNASEALYRMGLIKLEYGDYFGSESTAIKALQLLGKTNDTTALSRLYMLLGISSTNRSDFESAEGWYDKAFRINTKIPEKSNVLNSLGVLSTKKGNYIKAIETLETANSLLEKSPDKAALNLLMVRDNLAYAKGKAGRRGAIEEILQIVKEKEAINNLLGQFASHTHLTDLYLAENKTTKAEIHAQKAFEIAERLNATESKLKALAYLMDLKENPAMEARLYKKLDDSIDLAHGELKNTVDKIAFQTAEKETENLQLKKDKAENQLLLAEENKQKWLMGGGLLATLATLTVFGFYYHRNTRQKRVIENLQKELHHRVKNNLSIIDTFIEVAKEEFADGAFQSKLAELQNRIESINEVHQQLYSNKDVTALNMEKYVERLAENVQKSFAKPEIVLSINIDEKIKIPADKSFPVGLIINEFLTNSYKYAFPDNEGKIGISIKEKGSNYELFLSDNGRGLPPGFDLKTTASFGTRVMKLLSEQLKGTFRLEGTDGVRLMVQFPKVQ